MAEENGDKKHDPTEKRLQDAREKGQVPRSQDLASAIILLVAIVLLMTLGMRIVETLHAYGYEMLSDPILLIPENAEMDSLEQSALAHFRGTIWLFMKPLSIFFCVLLLTGIVANIAQIGFMWLPDKMKIDFTHLDPIKGLKRIFSLQSVVRLLMGILKIVICGGVAWYAIYGSIGDILALSDNETGQIASFLAWILLMIALKIAIALVVLALIDLMYQRWKSMQDLRMTDDEIRQEFKNMIGDPQILNKRRQIQREMAQRQGVQGTQDADVVVTNPTHYAVAIKFDIKTMDMPMVVAKGTDYMAFQIKQIAAEHRIPVVERKPLARALFASIEIGQPIMLEEEHMRTLAEVLAFAYRMSGRYYAGELDKYRRS